MQKLISSYFNNSLSEISGSELYKDIANQYKDDIANIKETLSI